MTGDKRDLWMWAAHRVSAMVMAPLVVVHLATMIAAVQGGLTAAEILERTRGSALWATVYLLFVVAASVHGAMGLRTVTREATRWRGVGLDLAALGAATLFIYLGSRAVLGVVL